MDPFEAIRNSADGLHNKLVGLGIDPLRPLDLVQRAIQHLDLRVCPLPPGDPALKGARAVFDEQSGTICYESTTVPAEVPLLVAHEIAHAEIHASSSFCLGKDIDPSQSSEVAPVGLQRVEDYGAKERRELQANIFAREFLFPRDLARTLFVGEELSATSISEKTGLPKNLIRQQVLDAVLLPRPDREDARNRTQERLVEPDVSQDEAAAHRGSPFLVQAGPGTGKTRTLSDRVGRLLSEGVDPSAILVLTFSNRAAGELAERIAQLSPSAAQRIWIGTFHAFGLDLVRRYHDKLGLSSDPGLFDRSDAIEILEEILPTLPLVHYRNLWDPALVLRDIVAAIARAKDEMADPKRYRALAETMLHEAKSEEAQVAAEKCLEIACVYDLYEQAKASRDSVDFGDLIMRPALLLESDARLRGAIQIRHRHVLVDEYQDVNRASGRLLKVLAGDGNNLWVVGDARQSIYRFRGASSSNMAMFGEDYAGAKTHSLRVNYRSTEEIVNAFTGFAERMGASQKMLPLRLAANRGKQSVRAEVRRYDSLDDEAEGLAASIRELQTAGVPLREQAVLCRGNTRLNEIAATLEAAGIPVLHLGSLFEREEVRDLLSLLSLAVDRYGGGLTRIGTMSRYKLSLQDVYAAIHSLSGEERALEALPKLREASGVSKEGAAVLTRLGRDLEGIKIWSSAWEFLTTYLLDRSDWLREIAKGESVRSQMQSIAIWQFLNFVRDQSRVGSGLPIRRTLDRVRQLVLLAEERDLRQVPVAALHINAVRLMTVHGSKGLEFEAIHVPGVTVASFPTSNHGQRCPPPVGLIAGAESQSVSDEAKQAHEHEEECLFFVALSRARSHLHLYLSQRQPSGKARNPSHFLDWLPEHTWDEILRPAKIALSSSRKQEGELVVLSGAPVNITDQGLQFYEKCPRRYFYSEILGISTASKSTAFLRTHGCLYSLIKWLVETRTTSEPTLEAAEAQFEEIWQASGPTDHGFASDYRRLASRLIGSLLNSGAGRRFRNAEPIAIDLPNGRVVVEPNEIAELPDGTVLLRRVHTGSKRSDEHNRLEYALYYLAGKEKFRKGFVVEAVHLADGIVEPVPFTERKLGTRQSRSDAMLEKIFSGQFPTDVDAVRCPRCPHFFLCPALPQGSLKLT